MKNLLLITIACLSCAMTCKQEPPAQDKDMQATFKADVTILKATPSLILSGTGGIINLNNDVTFTLSSNLLTLGGGNLSVGTNSILGTGNIGGTGAGKFAKGWFTDLEITNLPTVNGVSLFTSPTFTGTTTVTSLNIGGTLITANGTEINKLFGLSASTIEMNYLVGLTENVQNALDNQTSNYNTIMTGTTSVEKLQIGTSADKILIEGVTDVGQGYTFTKDGAELAPKIPDANQVNINTIAVMLAELSGSLTDGVPTDAQIDAIIGTTPALKGAGYKVTIKDTDGTGLLYFIESDGTSWFYTTFTKAL